MNVKDINVARPQPLQTLPDPEVHTLDRVTHRIDILGLPIVEPAILGRNDQPVPVPPSFHPLSDPFLGLSKVVQVGSIDKVAPGFDKRVEKLKSGFLGDLAGEICRRFKCKRPSVKAYADTTGFDFDLRLTCPLGAERHAPET